MKQSITFALSDEAAAIVRRAAAELRLPVIDEGPDRFRVELTNALDAYRLGEACVKDPAWARVFLREA